MRERTRERGRKKERESERERERDRQTERTLLRPGILEANISSVVGLGSAPDFQPENTKTLNLGLRAFMGSEFHGRHLDPLDLERS